MIKSALIVLGIIVILLASTAVLGGVAFTKRTRNEAKELFKESDMTKPKVITEEDVQNLPEPVQRYLRYTHHRQGRNQHRQVKTRRLFPHEGRSKVDANNSRAVF